MVTKRRGVTLAMGAAVIPLALGGCQADLDVERPSSPGVVRLASSVTPSDVSVPHSSPEAAVFLPSTPVPADFPLVPYWAAVRRLDEAIIGSVEVQQLENWWNSREAALAECMKREGFDFRPRAFHDPTADNDEQVALDRDYLHVPYLPPRRAEVEAAGYGIEPRAEDRPPATDPNQAYVESLDPDSRSAYYVALDGVDTTAADHDPFAPRDESAGCAAAAERDHPEPQAAEAPDPYSRHGDLLSDLASLTRGADIFSDAEVIALNREWRACMARKGYEPDDPPSDASSWAGPYQAVARARLTDPSGTLGIITDDPSSVLPDEQSRLVGSVPEREIALHDFDCRQETDYLAVFTAAQRRLEKDFVTAHGEELDSLLALADGLD